MANIRLRATGLRKVFNRRTIFSGIDFEAEGGGSITVTGKNGSGKSTLLKIVAGVLSPTRGSIELSLDGIPVKHDSLYSYIGFVAPYLQLYDEFSPAENLEFFRKVRGLPELKPGIADLMARFGLEERMKDPLRTFSSGMKQRVKYAFALVHDPPVLLLDEPTSNLDAAGIETVYGIVEEQKRRGIVIIATNDAGEIQRCEQVLDLDMLRQSSGKGG